jgi:hypothetical protein
MRLFYIQFCRNLNCASLTLSVLCLQTGSVPTVELCDCCHKKLLKKEAGDFSIANGTDFGNPRRLGLPPPTELERVILAVVRLYSSVVQLSARAPKGKSLGKVLRGHFISFFQVRFCVEYFQMIIMYIH